MITFESLGLQEDILKAVTDLGFVSPTPIQEKAIPVLLGGDRDFVGLAQTGTGKTAAFGLPLLHQLNVKLRAPQSLILCPTRELCLQIANDLKNFSKYLGDVSIVAVYGGASIVQQLREIKRGAHIIVATPGRLLDIIDRGAINFDSVRYAILDEADEMLNMGFQEDINNILSKTPAEKTTWLFSATMPQEVRRIAQKYMNDPFELTVGTKNSGNVNIEHEYYVVRPRDKYAALKRIVDYNPDIFGIIFTRTKLDSQEIAESLIRDGYNADALHGDLTQQQRDKVMKRFRERGLQVLVATDVAARGIDVDSVTHVINYELPDDVENYTHRSGRTGRAGKSGVSIAIITGRDVGKIRQIERVLGKKFVKAEVPDGFAVCEKQLFGLVHKVHNVTVNDEQIEPYLERIYEEFQQMSKEELIKRFASLEFNEFLAYYENAEDLNVKEVRRGEAGDTNTMSQRSSGRFTRLFINLGSVDDFNRGDMLRYLCDSTGLKGNKIGRIDLKGVYSFFEVENDVLEQVQKSFTDLNYNGRSVRIEMSQDGDKRGGGGYRGNSGGSRSYGGGDRRKSYGDREGGGGRREYSSGRPSYKGKKSS
ncbi:ATP-dependent RNA helicase DeaD [Chitinophaga costaii]|uniref:DEAD-box ATP-dependent RNA helicase RhpA n=1 Tax=Chitinophaga costaii TaxID=1335309 RepID=A0A1C4CGJ4_9BACT|nr:DEAD/DEAH box helicase [Chitinophaga costaii]PUZ27098.1 ATP-dependent RNA helicase [Chitinophaga costaii]SCC18209.1 ATP-dependent RNA helicase DeaD [Chitinophaga costaii]